MGVVHGALVYLKKDGQRIAKVTNFSIDRETPLNRSEPLGQHAPDELIHMGSYVRCSFEIEQVSNKSIVTLGLFPPQANIEDMINHPASMIEVEDRESGVTLHRVTGFKTDRVSNAYRKGDISMHSVSGEGIKDTDEGEN